MPARKPKLWPCERCGDLVFKIKRSDRHMYCLDCVAKVIESSALQMRAKSGPAWDAWVASNATGASGRPST